MAALRIARRTVRSASPRSRSNPSPAPAAGSAAVGLGFGLRFRFGLEFRIVVRAGGWRPAVHVISTGAPAIRAGHEPPVQFVSLRERPDAAALRLRSGRPEQHRGAKRSLTRGRALPLLAARVGALVRTRTAHRAVRTQAGAGRTSCAESVDPDGAHAIAPDGTLRAEPIRSCRAKRPNPDTIVREPGPGAQPKQPLTRGPVAVHC